MCSVWLLSCVLAGRNETERHTHNTRQGPFLIATFDGSNIKRHCTIEYTSILLQFQVMTWEYFGSFINSNDCDNHNYDLIKSNQESWTSILYQVQSQCFMYLQMQITTRNQVQSQCFFNSLIISICVSIGYFLR